MFIIERCTFNQGPQLILQHSLHSSAHYKSSNADLRNCNQNILKPFHTSIAETNANLIYFQLIPEKKEVFHIKLGSQHCQLITLLKIIRFSWGQHFAKGLFCTLIWHQICCNFIFFSTFSLPSFTNFAILIQNNNLKSFLLVEVYKANPNCYCEII